MNNTSPESTIKSIDALLQREGSSALKRGWTTGSCAAAAAKSAVHALIHGHFLDPVEIILPKGQCVSFSLSREALEADYAFASVIKDAGDDPDITHGASIQVTAKKIPGDKDDKIVFVAGEGIGVVTKPGLPIAIGEPSITPVPRTMITQAVRQIAKTGGFELTFSIPEGEKMARQTMNPRLGVIGGLSILGTTGIVIPYSCASWIHSIHRGIDVARAMGLEHVVGSTGATSEKLAQNRFGLTDQALIDMGDFVGGLLKYIKAHPIARLTLAGGIGKMAKLAMGEMDLHSSRSQVNIAFLAQLADNEQILNANTAAQALAIDPQLANLVAKASAQKAQKIAGENVVIDTLITTREGEIVGEWTA